MEFETVDTMELVPEELRADVIERKDGKFSFAKPKAAEDAGAGAVAALAAERTRAATATQRAKDAATALTAAQAEVQRLKDEMAVKSGAVSAEAVAAINTRVTTIQSEADTKVAAAEEKARKSTTRADAQLQAIASGSVRDKQTLGEYLDLISPFLGVDDKSNTIVLDAAGNPTGEPLDKAMAKGGSLRRKWAFLGTGSSGGGGEGSDDDAPTSAFDAAKAGRDAAAKEKASRSAASTAFK